MKAPIIVTDRDGNTTVYESAGAAERDIESIDVESGEYTVYDAAGRLLSFAVFGEPEPPRKLVTTVEPRPVKLTQLEDTPTHQPALLAQLDEAQRAARESGEFDRAQQLEVRRGAATRRSCS